MYLLARSDTLLYNAFVKHGAAVTGWFQVKERGQQLSAPMGVDVVDWRDIEQCNVPHVFSKDLSVALAKRVRDICYPYFVRMQDRMYWFHFERTDTWLDINNRLEIMIHYFHNFLKKNKISCVVSTDVPHEGPHIILHTLAQEMGIESIIAMQSLEENAFWIFRDFKDLGKFKTSYPKPRDPIRINEVLEKPFYMCNSGIATPLDSKKNRLYKMKMLANSIPFAIGWRTRSYKKSLFKIDQVRRLKKISDMIEYDSFNLTDRYVYFPLHLQPEMTTDALGHEYCDQLLAIEELLRKLPEDVFVYVKENPKQTAQMREPSFFERMKVLPQVKYLSPDVDSFELMRNAEVVATITGTAGWEALQIGKPVITFGSAWYRALSGVFEWSNEFEYNAISGFIFESSKLTKDLEWLSQFLREGVVDKNYASIVPNFSASDNAQLVASEIIEFHEACKQQTL